MNNAICTEHIIMEVILNIYQTGIIYQTTNYSQFTITRKNRPIAGKRIIDSIKKKNLLPEKPILVTSNLVVLDGQHRLKAAEALQLPIFFQIARKNVTDEDLAILNVQKSWELLNYINLFWDKNENYAFIQHILDTYGLNAYVSFVINSAGSGNDIKASFKDGEYKLKESKEVIEMRMRKVSECRTELIKRFNNHKIVTAQCLYALYQLTKYSKYNHKRFIEKINKPCYKDDFYKALEFRKNTLLYTHLKIINNK